MISRASAPVSCARSSGTVNDWLANRGDEVDVSAGGEKPLPRVGRHFCCDAYSDVSEEIMSEFDEIAAERGK